MHKAWMLIVVAALAGCVGSPEGPADGDGTGPGSSAPPATPSPTTSAPGAGGGPGFAPQSDSDAARGKQHPGIVLEGNMSACPQGTCVDVDARNEGAYPVHVSSICVAPWSESMEGPQGAVQHREPMAVCLAFGTSPFAPGETLHYEAAWNATVWQDDRYVPAPQGVYQWSVHLRVYGEPDGADAETVTVTFTVVVGPT